MCSSPRPDERSAQSRTKPRRPCFVNRSLRDGTLGLDARYDAVHVCLDDHASHNHFAKRRVQGLEVEDQVQLAHILEQLVQRLDVDLDQVEQRQRRLGRRRYYNEVQSRIVAVGDERGDVVVRFRGGMRSAGSSEDGGQREEVACAVGSVGDEGEDLRD